MIANVAKQQYQHKQEYQQARQYAQRVEAARAVALSAFRAAQNGGTAADVRKAAKEYDFAAKAALRACEVLHKQFLRAALSDASQATEEGEPETLCVKCGGKRVRHGTAQRWTCLHCLAELGKRNGQRLAAIRQAKAHNKSKQAQAKAQIQTDAKQAEQPLNQPAKEQPTKEAEKPSSAPPAALAPAAAAFDWQDAQLQRCLRMAKESKSLIDQGYFFIVTRNGVNGYVCVGMTGPHDTPVLEVTARTPPGKTRQEWIARLVATGEEKSVGVK